MVAREALFELCDGRLKVVLAVGEAAATDHHVAQAGEIRLSDVLIAIAHLPHGHGGQRHGAVQQRLQRRGHAIAVQREAEQQQIALQDLIQDVPHVVVMDACAAVALAGKAASAVFDMFVDHINDMDILRRRRLHPFQECAGDVQGVAVFTLGTSVKNKNLHGLTSFSILS